MDLPSTLACPLPPRPQKKKKKKKKKKNKITQLFSDAYPKKQFSKQKISYTCAKKLKHFDLDVFWIRLCYFLYQQNLTN